MNYFYILSKQKILIEGGKVDSERFLLLKKITDFEPYSNILIAINIDLLKLEKEIDTLLKARQSKPIEFPTYMLFWEGIKHSEEYLYKNELIILYNTYTDNSLLFLMNIYIYITQDDNLKKPCFLLLTKTRSEYEELVINES